MEDIKKTIEFANSKDKLEVDIEYDELRQAIKKRDRFYNIVGIVFCLPFIGAIVFGIMSLEILAGVCLFAAIVCFCICIFFEGTDYDTLLESEFENAYNFFCNTINYSKDIYLKVYENNIEISYFSKKDGSYETKDFISLTDKNNIKYIDADNFKIVGRLINDVYKLTLYMPVKYNTDYLEFVQQKENI